MLIDISLGSRFWAFDLARELDHHGAMRTLHTGYPAFSARSFGLRPGMIRSVWTHEIFNRLSNKAYRRGWLKKAPDAVLSSRFDRIVANRLEPGADIFIGWSSQCRHSLARAKALGMTTIVERGSTHILWQHAILSEEKTLTGMPVDLPLTDSIDAELAEYAEADYIALPSKFTADTFIEKGIPAEKLLVNPYGVDVKQFAFVDRNQSLSSLRVIHVGQCSARKGIHYLIDAVGLLQNTHLTLVGSYQSPAIEKLRRNYTTFIGPVPGAQLPKFYADADVFCLLSLEEGMALVIAQAMASGLPVIVTPNTGGQELVTDGVDGFIVPIRAPEMAAEKLALLQNNLPLRLEMGRRAREKIMRGFSWADYGNRALVNYRRVLKTERLPGLL